MVRPVDVEELQAGDPAAVAAENAQRKALAGTASAPRGPDSARPELVLGVDTLVTREGVIYGKPPDEAAARETLGRLGGAVHEVISGLALQGPAGLHSATVSTLLTMRPLSDVLLEAYLATGEWRDRAGGYAIQGRGALLIADLHGDYPNVVGLPLKALHDLLQSTPLCSPFTWL